MADFWGGADNEEEEDDIETSKEYNTRDDIVFLVDARPHMLVVAGESLQGFAETDSWLSIALKIIKVAMKGRIIGSASDKISIILYGTRERQNENNFDHVFALHALGEGSARRLRELDDILAGGFEASIGSATNGSSVQDLEFALRVAQQQLLKSPAGASRAVEILTNDLDPAALEDDGMQDLRSAVIGHTKELRDAGIDTRLVPLLSTGQKLSFPPGSIWPEALGLGEDDVDQPFELQTLATVQRCKGFKKRPLRTTLLQLGPDFQLQVQLFRMLHKAVKARKVQVDAISNAEVIRESAALDADTGHILTKAMLTHYSFPKAAMEGKECRFPRVLFSKDEIADIKRVQAEGIHILGFKPLECLRDYHNLKEPTFVYPTDKELKGSRAAFIALHAAMLQEPTRFAVASAVTGKAVAPQLVALLAQQEELDDDGGQMIALPWADDIRAPEADAGFVGDQHVFADTAQIEAAEKMMNALQLPDNFYSCEISHPSIQRHYQVLEALALSEEPGPQGEDATLPDPDFISAAEQEIQAFRDATFLTAAVMPKASAKRKAPALDAEMDVKKLAAEGGLSRLTIPQLKEICGAQNLKKVGKKDELVDRIMLHLAS